MPHRTLEGFIARILFACIVAIAALFAMTSPTSATPTPGVMPGPPGFHPKDFTFIRDGEWIHCFYILVDEGVSGDTGTRFGHSRSKDLICWEYVDSPFGPGTAPWDNSRVWAPHIIKVDNVFYMFYTGVSNDAQHPGHQSIGVATSSNLVTWARSSIPLMDCAAAAWTQCQTGVNSGGQLRDPFVMADPGTAGRWLAYYGAVTPDGFMLPGVAASTSLGASPWSDLGPLWTRNTTDPGLWWTTQGQVESPHLLSHGGNWYLLFTSNAGTAPITILTNPNPLGAAETWTMRGRIHSMLSASMGGASPDAGLWFASEYFKDTDDREYFACVDGLPYSHLLFYEMQWQSDWRFTLASPGVQVTTVTAYSSTGGSTVTEGHMANITINAANWQGRTVTLEALEKDAGQPDELISAADLALDSPVTLTGPSTMVAWQSRFVGDADPSPTRNEFSFRVKAEPCVASNLLYVQQQATGDHDPYETDARAGRTSGDPEVAASNPPSATELRFRVLRETPLGAGIGLLVDLPEATSAQLDVFDPLGRRVRQVADRAFPKGASVELWDGRSDAGIAAVAGVYFARLRTANGVRVARFFYSPR